MTVRITAKIGTAIKRPTIPPISPPIRRASIIITGCIRNDFPTIYGERMLLSTNCKMASAMPALIKRFVDTVAAIINVGIAPKIGPK